MNVLRVAQVIHKTGIPRPSLYRMMAQGRFPRPIKLADRAVGWVEGDVDSWISARVTESKAFDRQVNDLLGKGGVRCPMA